MLVIEVGGSSRQATEVELPRARIVELHSVDPAQPWLLASPGQVEGDRVRHAHHIGWTDAIASRELGMGSPPLLSMNDADAAALGEWFLRGQPHEALLYLGLGTGVGASLLISGEIQHLQLSHGGCFGPRQCEGCGNTGCLDAQIGGHALPSPLTSSDVERVAETAARAIAWSRVQVDTIMLGGGMARRYPDLISRLSKAAGIPVAPSRCAGGFKSAAPWGLVYQYLRMTRRPERLPSASQTR